MLGIFRRIFGGRKNVASSERMVVVTTTLPNPMLFNAIYRRGTDLIRPYMSVVGREPAPMTPASMQEINEGIRCLRDAIRMEPGHWNSFWISGMAYRALNELAESYAAFKRAFEINPAHPDVAREYVISCVKLGHGEEAVVAGRKACQLEPQDAGHVANLALAFLISGRIPEAVSTIDDSLRIDPQDPISIHVKKKILKVQNGEEPCPRAFL